MMNYHLIEDLARYHRAELHAEADKERLLNLAKGPSVSLRDRFASSLRSLIGDVRARARARKSLATAE
jgi:hypothetical protein